MLAALRNVFFKNNLAISQQFIMSHQLKTIYNLMQNKIHCLEYFNMYIMWLLWGYYDELNFWSLSIICKGIIWPYLSDLSIKSNIFNQWWFQYIQAMKGLFGTIWKKFKFLVSGSFMASVNSRVLGENPAARNRKTLICCGKKKNSIKRSQWD